MCKSKSQEIFEYLKLCVTYFSHQKLPEIVKKLRVDYINAIHGQKEVVHKQQSLSFHPQQSFDRCMITHVNFCFYSRACFVNSSKSSSRSRFLGMLPTKRRWLLNDIVTPSFFPFLSSKSFNWKTRKCYRFMGLKVQEDIHSSISGTSTRCSQIQ